ncbi:hypothetical protein ACHAPV_008095 [Trichoderma viride]
MSTCGFQNGDPNKMRTADPGFDCRVDTMNGLWGFCPVTVIAATDCGLAGSCVDQASCSSGCGQTGMNQLTTFTCGPKQFCSTALLTFGVDQTYTYIACGAILNNDEYEADEHGSGFIIIVQVNKCISWQHIRAIKTLNN